LSKHFKFLWPRCSKCFHDVPSLHEGMRASFHQLTKGLHKAYDRASKLISYSPKYQLPVLTAVALVLVSAAAIHRFSESSNSIEALIKVQMKSNLTIPSTGVQVSRIKSLPPFNYGYLHPDDDNYQVRNPNITALEPGLTRLWLDDIVSLSKCCRKGGIVVDIGSHFGYYALLAGSIGCQVIAVEPVPLFRSVLEMNLKLNSDISRSILVLPYAIGQESKESVTMFVPTAGILGTARVLPDEQTGQDKIHVRQERLDVLFDDLGIHQDICMLKADVEGQEPDVISSAKKLVKRKKIRNVMLEFSPGYKKDGLDEMLSLFHENEYCGIEIPWHWAKFHGTVDKVPLNEFIGKSFHQSFATEKERNRTIEEIATRFNTNLFFSLNCTG
jgi:FkbM family methyltransferase